MQAKALYTAQQVKEGEQKLSTELGIEMFELMERAGKAVFEHIKRCYPNNHNIHIFCGSGNNGGDGYISARLAKASGYNVTLVHIGDLNRVKGDAKIAQEKWSRAGGKIETLEEVTSKQCDLIVDALLGTGFEGELSIEYAQVISHINLSDADAVSIDVPSGLCSDTGFVSGECVEATHTVSLIGLKRGLFTGLSANYTGEIVFSGLGVSDAFNKENPTNISLISKAEVNQHLTKRPKASHKGNFGRVLCLGGDRGMFGAIRLTSEACARVGAGITRVVTQPENVSALVSARPEIMVFDWRGNSNEINDHLWWTDVIALGPGLGNSSWGRSLVGYSRTVEKPIVVDADGLNLLAKTPDFNSRRVITPHPGEAAKLLNSTTLEIERDRFASAKKLQLKYGGVVVLKGAGTVVYDGDAYWVCKNGNPGMATGGMGDVLTGIIAGLIAQGLSLAVAARVGVWIHATAADICAEADGERGLLAADLFVPLRCLANGL
ncbi:NAD(P)H-hydrate dehydratase [Vibrio algarum]|uniref:Bifunctional NAD(P)H-hydrate repair enzyme n=1 Tax=Vibrio algarum TaxID=3020714 RepID=A0ABT4YX83_9VIBR|nr:NAD(P)H-hydrate dehydratase [Vibrio sp. KJ40-1]MDB1126204.1 NAD(P)H-hydrate dehydratase [Vibrio sp. KJ40-1]